MNAFFLGLKSYGRAWRLARTARLWPLLILPGLISLLYFPAIAYLTWRFGGRLTGYVWDHWLPAFLKQPYLEWIITAALWLLGLYLGFILFRNVIMILYSPVLGFLSGKTEEKAQPESPRPDLKKGILSGAVRGITMSLVSLFLEVGCFVFCVLLLLVPVIGQIAMVVVLPAAQMFLAGHGFMDPPLERRKVSVKESFRFVWQHRGRTLGCGCGFVLLSLIPVIGWFLAPTLGIVAGTLVTLDVAKEGREDLQKAAAARPVSAA